MGSKLPAGQRARSDFPRFGLPAYAGFRLPAGNLGRVQVRGIYSTLLLIEPEELRSLPRHEGTSDLHCVTTWSAVGLHWAGYRFNDLYQRLIEPRIQAGAEWVVFRGLDGYRSSLPLQDVRAESVMLVDSLDSRPLTLEHGAPLRLIAPDHYGYKSVKHLAAIEFRRSFLTGQGPNEHPRARVSLEERGRVGPGWALRYIYRPLVPRVIEMMSTRPDNAF